MMYMVADMEMDKVADMELEMVADMEEDKVADMEVYNNFVRKIHQSKSRDT